MDAEVEIVGMENVQTDQDEQICDVCKISYSTEQELRDHIWSFMHHIKLEQRKKGSVHNCTLCFTTCPNIIEYGKHLNGEKHKKAVEEGRRQTEEENMTIQKEALLNKLSREKEESLPVQLNQPESMETDGNMSDPEVSRRFQNYGNHNRSGKGHQRAFSQPQSNKLKWRKKDKKRSKERLPDLSNQNEKYPYSDDYHDNQPWQQMYTGQFHDHENWWQEDVPSWNQFNQQPSFQNYWENPENFVPPEFQGRFRGRYDPHRSNFRNGPQQQHWQDGDFHHRFAEMESREPQANPRHSHNYNDWQERQGFSDMERNKFNIRGNTEFSDNYCESNIRFDKQNSLRQDSERFNRYQDAGQDGRSYNNSRQTFDPTNIKSGRFRHSVGGEPESGNFKRRRGNDATTVKARKEVRFDLPSDNIMDKNTITSSENCELQNSPGENAHPNKRTKFPTVSSSEADSTTNTDTRDRKSRLQKNVSPAADRKKIDKKKKKKSIKKSALEASFEESTKPAMEGLSILEKAEKLCKELREKREQAKKEKDLKDKQNKMSKTEELNSQIKTLEEINKGYVKGHLLSAEERMGDLPIDTNLVLERHTSKMDKHESGSLHGKDTERCSSNSKSLPVKSVTARSKTNTEHSIDEIRQEIESSVKSGRSSADKGSLSNDSRSNIDTWSTDQIAGTEKVSGKSKYQTESQQTPTLPGTDHPSVTAAGKKMSPDLDKSSPVNNAKLMSSSDPNSEVAVSSTTDNWEGVNKENLLKLVNSPRSRKERQNLAEMLRSYADSKTRLSLPRFNMQLSDLTTGLEDVTQELRLEDLSADVQLQIAQLIEQDFKPDMQTLERTLFSSDVNSESNLEDKLPSVVKVKLERTDPSANDLNEAFLSSNIPDETPFSSSLDPDFNKTSRKSVHCDSDGTKRFTSSGVHSRFKSSEFDSYSKTSNSVHSKPDVVEKYQKNDKKDLSHDISTTTVETTALVEKYLNKSNQNNSKDSGKFTDAVIQRQLFPIHERSTDNNNRDRSISLGITETISYGKISDQSDSSRMTDKDECTLRPQSSIKSLNSGKSKTNGTPLNENRDLCIADLSSSYPLRLKQEPSEVSCDVADKPMCGTSFETDGSLKDVSPFTMKQKSAEMDSATVIIKQEPEDFEEYFGASYSKPVTEDRQFSVTDRNKVAPSFECSKDHDLDRTSKPADIKMSNDLISNSAEKAVSSGSSLLSDDFYQPLDTALTMAALQDPAVVNTENNIESRVGKSLVDLRPTKDGAGVTGNLYSQSMMSSVSSTDSLFFDTVYDLSVQEEDIRKEMMTTGAEVTRLSQVIQQASEHLKQQKSKLKELAEKEETLRRQRIKVLREAKQMQNSSQFGSSVDTIASTATDNIRPHCSNLRDCNAQLSVPSDSLIGTQTQLLGNAANQKSLEAFESFYSQNAGYSKLSNFSTNKNSRHFEELSINSSQHASTLHPSDNAGKSDTLYAASSAPLFNSNTSSRESKETKQNDIGANSTSTTSHHEPENNIRISSVFSMATSKLPSDTKHKQSVKSASSSSSVGKFDKQPSSKSSSKMSSKHKKTSKHTDDLDSSSGPFMSLELLTDSSDCCDKFESSADANHSGIASPVALKDKKKDRKIYETLPPPLQPFKDSNTSFGLSGTNITQAKDTERELKDTSGNEFDTNKSTELKEAGFFTLNSLLSQAAKDDTKHSPADGKMSSASVIPDSPFTVSNNGPLMDPIKTLNMLSSPTSSGRLNIQYMGSIPSSEDSPLSSPTTSKLNMQFKGGLPRNVLVVDGGQGHDMLQKLQSMFKTGDQILTETNSTATQSSSGDAKMELDCKSESSFKSDEIVLETDSNYESAGMASNAESLGERIKKYCNSNDKKGARKGKKGKAKEFVSDSGSDRTLKDEAFNSDLVNTPVSNSEFSKMKNCTVVLNTLDSDPVAKTLFTSPESLTLSPSRKRRKTKKQRDKTSVRKQKEEFILPSSSDGSSDEDEPLSGLKQKVQNEEKQAAIVDEMCLVETGSDDMEVIKQIGAYRSKEQKDEVIIVDDHSQVNRKSLLDEVQLDTESDIGTPPRSHLSEKFKLKPEIVSTVRDVVRRSIPRDDMEEEEIVRMEGPPEPVAALQLVVPHVVVAYQNSNPQKFDLQTGESLGVFDCHSHRICCLSIVTVKHSSIMYAGGPSKVFYQFDFDRMITLKTETMEQKIQTMLSVWGRIYIGTDCGDVVAKSVQNGRTFDVFHCASQPITCISSATEGMRKVILVAAFNSPIYVCDATSGLLLRVMEGHSKNSTYFCIHVDGHDVYGGSGDKTLKKHNLLTGELLHTYECQGIVTGTSSTSNGPYVYCAGYDRVIRCFNKATHQLHCQYYGADFGTITTLALEENKILTGSRDGVVEVLNLDPEDRVFTCKCFGCGIRFGAKQHLFHHLKTQHINNTRVFKCKWEGCTERMSTTGDQKFKDVDTHLKAHIDEGTS